MDFLGKTALRMVVELGILNPWKSLLQINVTDLQISTD